MNVHKERTGHLSPFSFFCFWGEERGKKLQRHLTNFLLGQHHPIGICECLDALVHILAQLREKLSSRQALVSFLDMLSPNIDRCYDVKSKRLDVSLNVLFNEVTSYFPFLN